MGVAFCIEQVLVRPRILTWFRPRSEQQCCFVITKYLLDFRIVCRNKKQISSVLYFFTYRSLVLGIDARLHLDIFVQMHETILSKC